MTWKLSWTRRSDADILAMHYEVSDAIVRVLLAFRVDGSDHAWMVHEHDGTILACVRHQGGHAIVRIDEVAETVVVLRIVPDEPLPYRAPLLDETMPEDEDES
jgi:hypothetical protein